MPDLAIGQFTLRRALNRHDVIGCADERECGLRKLANRGDSFRTSLTTVAIRMAHKSHFGERSNDRCSCD